MKIKGRVEEKHLRLAIAPPEHGIREGVLPPPVRMYSKVGSVIIVSQDYEIFKKKTWEIMEINFRCIGIKKNSAKEKICFQNHSDFSCRVSDNSIVPLLKSA